MRRTVVIVEGPTDAEVLGLLLQDIHKRVGFDFYVAGGRDAGRPIARALLLNPGVAIAFIYDADTSDVKKARTEQRSLEEYLRWTARATQFLVQPLIPELEIVFFKEPGILKDTLGIDLSPEQHDAGLEAPKRVLTTLLRRTGIPTMSAFVGRLGKREIELMRRDEAIKPIRQFLEEQLAHK
jgi:hypothetical protein